MTHYFLSEMSSSRKFSVLNFLKFFLPLLGWTTTLALKTGQRLSPSCSMWTSLLPPARQARAEPGGPRAAPRLPVPPAAGSSPSSWLWCLGHSLMNTEQRLGTALDLGTPPHQLGVQGGSPQSCPSTSHMKSPHRQPSLTEEAAHGMSWAWRGRSSRLFPSWKQPCLGGYSHVQCLGETTGCVWPPAPTMVCSGSRPLLRSKPFRKLRESGQCVGCCRGGG